MDKQIPIQFIGEVTGVPFQITPEITKARLRIFYKGLNRNGGFITDEFAEKLLTSLPYAPVVGIYNDLTKEFSGHDPNRNTAKIYGVVPQDPNMSWEDHLDKDGIMRTYACCDVYLYTGRYDAARQIVGKQHSMELNEKTIRGDWRAIDEYGTEAYVYTDARFIGLSVLGDNKEPCFEGSAFFELVTKFSNFMMDNTSNGGTEMTTKEKEKESSFENENANDFVDKEKEKEENNKKEEKKEEEKKEEEKKEETPSNDNEAKEEKDNKGEENKDEPSDAACNPERKDSACDPNKKDAACDPDKKDYEDKKKEPDDKADEKSDELDDDEDDDEEEGDMSDSSSKETPKDSSEDYSKENFEKLNNKILELEKKITTFETEANKYKGLYESLKVDYDNLVSEKNKELFNLKKNKIQEYSAYLSSEVKENFENNLNNYSTVEDLEKDLLFAAKPSLFASHENFAPTSTYEVEEEDELAAFIREKINKH